MHPDGGPWFMSRGPRWTWVLCLVWSLAGCATTSGGWTPTAWSDVGPRFGGPRRAGPSRVLLAMNGDAPGGESSGPVLQGYNVPGRNPDSQMPWEFFLGNASHRLIAYMYGVNHPRSETYYNTKCIRNILDESGLGDASLLPAWEQRLCPDIIDVLTRILFEIKPWNERGLQEGRVEARKYLTALNRTLLGVRPFEGGTEFSGEILIRFAGGNYIWRLEWKTPEPGVVQYRWTRSQQPFDSEAAAYQAAQWTEITESELRQYGGWVEKAVEGIDFTHFFGCRATSSCLKVGSTSVVRATRHVLQAHENTRGGDPAATAPLADVSSVNAHKLGAHAVGLTRLERCATNPSATAYPFDFLGSWP